MARQPRYNIPGQPQHIIQRGNNRDPVFCRDDDYLFYRDKLADACKRHACDLHAYVLMTNHTHLLITPQTEDGIGKSMQSLGRYYVQYFNHSYQRTGTLWEGRYRSTLLDSEGYLLICMRYIELNPIRADMVTHPRGYPWSSYAHNALGREDPLITPHDVYLRLGQNTEERQQAYRALFKGRISEITLTELRESTNKAWVLGSNHFKERVAMLTQRQVTPKTRGGDRRSKKFQERKNNNRV